MNEVLIMLDFLLGLIIGRSNPNQCFTVKNIINIWKIKDELKRKLLDSVKKKSEKKEKKDLKKLVRYLLFIVMKIYIILLEWIDS